MRATASPLPVTRCGRVRSNELLEKRNAGCLMTSLTRKALASDRTKCGVYTFFRVTNYMRMTRTKGFALQEVPVHGLVRHASCSHLIGKMPESGFLSLCLRYHAMQSPAAAFSPCQVRRTCNLTIQDASVWGSYFCPPPLLSLLTILMSAHFLR